MALIRWEPAREVESLQQEVNRFFGTFFDSQTGRAGTTGGRRWLPAIDLVEADGSYVLHADLPGVKPEDVTIELDDDVLTIAGHRETDSESDEGGVRRRERAYGKFSRRLTVPAGVDPEGITASFEHGVLDVRIPKPEQPKPRRVAIQVGGEQAAPATERGEQAEPVEEGVGSEV